MNSKHCPNCHCIRVIKKGKQNGRQRYLCKNCSHMWERARRSKNNDKQIWQDYANRNLSIVSLRCKYGMSDDAIRKAIANYRIRPPQDHLRVDSTIRTIIMDATYIEGRSHGLLVAINACNGSALYAKELYGAEKIIDYELALRAILPFLPNLRACVIDSRKGVREMLLSYGLLVQHCQFHQIQLITQKLSRHPKSEAGIELRRIGLSIARSNQDAISNELELWEECYGHLLKEKTYYRDKQGKLRWHYTHRNLRSAFNGLRRNLPYLYIYQQYPEYKIPNTSNRIDGLFGVIKKHIRTHSGCSLALKIKLWFYFLSVGTGVKKN